MIEVAFDFTPEYVFDTRFSGQIRLGVFDKEFQLPGGMIAPKNAITDLPDDVESGKLSSMHDFNARIHHIHSGQRFEIRSRSLCVLRKGIYFGEICAWRCRNRKIEVFALTNC